MRVALLIILLGTVAPVAAGPVEDRRGRVEARDDGDQPRARSGGRRQSSDDDGAVAAPRRDRSESRREPARIEPAAERDFAAPSPRRSGGDRDYRAGEAPERPALGFGRRFERTAPEAEPVTEAEAPAPGPRVIEAPRSRRRTGDTVADWRIRDRGDGTAPQLVEEREGSVPDSMRDPRRRQLERFARRGDADGRNAPAVSPSPREGTQPPVRTEARPTRFSGSHWRGDWRRDRRYDWRSWRDRHRSRFRFGIYYDPFGWSYRRYHIGWRLWPSYYHRSYWLHDPNYFRLPYAPPGYRWIRYYDDALLVDTWDGRVVDVIHNFFW